MRGYWDVDSSCDDIFVFVCTFFVLMNFDTNCCSVVLREVALLLFH